MKLEASHKYLKKFIFLTWKRHKFSKQRLKLFINFLENQLLKKNYKKLNNSMSSNSIKTIMKNKRVTYTKTAYFKGLLLPRPTLFQKYTISPIRPISSDTLKDNDLLSIDDSLNEEESFFTAPENYFYSPIKKRLLKKFFKKTQVEKRLLRKKRRFYNSLFKAYRQRFAHLKFYHVLSKISKKKRYLLQPNSTFYAKIKKLKLRKKWINCRKARRIKKVFKAPTVLAFVLKKASQKRRRYYHFFRKRRFRKNKSVLSVRRRRKKKRKRKRKRKRRRLLRFRFFVRKYRKFIYNKKTFKLRRWKFFRKLRKKTILLKKFHSSKNLTPRYYKHLSKNAKRELLILQFSNKKLQLYNRKVLLKKKFRKLLRKKRKLFKKRNRIRWRRRRKKMLKKKRKKLKLRLIAKQEKRLARYRKKAKKLGKDPNALLTRILLQPLKKKKKKKKIITLRRKKKLKKTIKRQSLTRKLALFFRLQSRKKSANFLKSCPSLAKVPNTRDFFIKKSILYYKKKLYNTKQIIAQAHKKFNYKFRKKMKKHKTFRFYTYFTKMTYKEFRSMNLPFRGVTFLRFFKRRRRFRKKANIISNHRGRHLRFKKRTRDNRTRTRKKYKKSFAKRLKMLKLIALPEEEALKIIRTEARIKANIREWLHKKKKLVKKARKHKKRRRLKLGKMWFKIKIKLRRKKKKKKWFRRFRQRLKRNINPRFSKNKRKIRRVMKFFYKNYFKRMNFGLPRKIGKRLLFRRLVKSRKKIRKIRNLLDTVINLQNDEITSESVKFIKNNHPYNREINTFPETLSRRTLVKSFKTYSYKKIGNKLNKNLTQTIFLKNNTKNNSANFDKLNYNTFRTKAFHGKQKKKASYYKPMDTPNTFELKNILIKILKYLHIQRKNITRPSYTTLFSLNTFKKGKMLKKNKLNLRLGYQGKFNKLMIMSLISKPIIIRNRKRFTKRKFFKKKKLRYIRFLMKYLKRRLRNNVLFLPSQTS